jgi:RHS repeat-associated protein
LYAPRSNRLLAVSDTEIKGDDFSGLLRTSMQGGRPLQAVLAYHPTGVPLAQFGRESRRMVYNAAKRPVAVYEGGRLIAEYRYNTQGERISKTVYDKSGLMKVGAQANAGRPTYYLYDHQRLSAEADEQGHLTAQYVYLGNAPIAKLEGEHVYAIHTDQLGSPQQVTDPQGKTVWQAAYRAFGEATVDADPDRDGKSFTLNLRLPGQYYDEETGLHYNYLRDYDPKTGRYVTSDPVGLAGGVNPYAYVGNDPLGAVDPLGLYEVDIHYYMTYFLAIAAGVDSTAARTMALAAQYIDDNPITQPLPHNLLTAIANIMFDNPAVQRRLESYHFTQMPEYDFTKDKATRFEDPEASGSNKQLTALHDAATKALGVGVKCAFAQFYGEYLHAFEDTFGHRDRENVPIPINQGFGHFNFGHQPDYTYNAVVTGQLVGNGNWDMRQARTLRMEEEVFNKLAGLAKPGNKAMAWSDVKTELEKFNKIRENESNAHDFKLYNGFLFIPPFKSQKITLLNDALTKWGYQVPDTAGGLRDIDLFGTEAYDEIQAQKNRAANLRYKDTGLPFIQQDFPGTILP